MQFLLLVCSNSTKMKRMDFVCASPASTAICSSINQRSVIRPGTRVIDRHNPHLREGARRSTSSSSSSNSSNRSRALMPCPSYPSTKVKQYNHQNTRKSSANPRDLKGPSPHESSRYLLSNTAVFDVLEFDPFSALVPIEPSKSPAPFISNESPPLKPPFSSIKPKDEVVVLRVSLHCKGCEGKVRKHISKMEGVTSFNIDFATKKVTVTGNVTPLGVLASISRVKNAQFWPSASAPSSVSTVGFAY